MQRMPKRTDALGVMPRIALRLTDIATRMPTRRLLRFLMGRPGHIKLGNQMLAVTGLRRRCMYRFSLRTRHDLRLTDHATRAKQPAHQP